MSSSLPIPHRSTSSGDSNADASMSNALSNRKGKRPVTSTPSPPSHSSFSSSGSSVRQGKMPASTGFGTPAFGAAPPVFGGQDSRAAKNAGRGFGESPVRGAQYEDVFGKRRLSSPREELSPRRASLLGEGLLRTEHIVVDVGEPDRPRLMCCVSSSQGFDWNRSIFLPRYLAGTYGDGLDDGELERRQDPIEDVIVTDEEASMMFPQ